MKKQLLIAYSFPPLANAESIVTANMVRALEDFGWETAAYTVKPKTSPGTKDMDVMDLIPPRLEIYRSTSLPGHKLTRMLRLLRFNKMAIFAASFPDETISWYPAALLRLNRTLRKTNCKLIHTRSMPITNHLLGLYAKRISRLPWLAHFSDPWIDSPFYNSACPSIKKLHSRWEYKIIEAADIVTFTTEAACKLVMSKYPIEWIEKCHVIPHGFETVSLQSTEQVHLDSQNLNIVYLGSFYGKRTPYPLFQAMKKYVREFDPNPALRIWLIGRMPQQIYANTIRSYGLENIVHLKGAVSYRKGLAYAQAADALLLVDTKCENPEVFLQSKLIEYLGINKPIWGIVSMSGVSAVLLKSIGCPIADIKSPSHIADSLKELIKKWQVGELFKPDLGKSEAQKYRLADTTRQLVSLLEAMIQIG